MKNTRNSSPDNVPASGCSRLAGIGGPESGIAELGIYRARLREAIIRQHLFGFGFDRKI